MKVRLWFLTIAALGLCTVFCIPSAQAAVFTLDDLNSSTCINTATQAGMYCWDVDDESHLMKQWFWYSLGAEEFSIDTLAIVGEAKTAADTLQVWYQLAGKFDLFVTYVLDGGAVGSGSSHISETIQIRNISGASLPFKFFQYTDFDLMSTPDDDSIVVMTTGSVPTAFLQTDGTASFAIAETIASPSPSSFQAGIHDTLLASLNDGSATVLDGTASAGPGNVEFIWAWDLNLPNNAELVNIFKDKRTTFTADGGTTSIPIPEPSSLLLLGGALVGMAVWVWRKQR